MIYAVNKTTRRALDDATKPGPRWRRETDLIAARAFTSTDEARAAIDRVVPKRERDQWSIVTHDELSDLISA